MSKDKGGKNVKKVPANGVNKSTLDYQAGKKTVSNESAPVNKKEKRLNTRYTINKQVKE